MTGRALLLYRDGRWMWELSAGHSQRGGRMVTHQDYHALILNGAEVGGLHPQQQQQQQLTASNEPPEHP